MRLIHICIIMHLCIFLSSRNQSDYFVLAIIPCGFKTDAKCGLKAHSSQLANTCTYKLIPRKALNLYLF